MASSASSQSPATFVNRLSPVRVVIVVADSPRVRPVRAWLSRNRTLVLFLLFLVATDGLIGSLAGVWNRASPDEYAARVAGCARLPRDVVFVGGSPVAEAIDPDRITANGYNLGLSGGTVSDFYHAVIHACPTPPRRMVYGITASDINDARHEPHGPHSLMTWGDLVGWVRLRPESGEWVTRHFVQSRFGSASNLYRHRHGIRMWLATWADEQIPGSCPQSREEAHALNEQAQALFDGNGYWPAKGYASGRYDHVKASGAPQAPFGFLNRYRTGSHLKFLHKLIDWCESNHVQLVLVDMPVTADLEARFVNEYAEFRRRLQEIESERGLKVLRPQREALGLTDADFADVIHMNREGARKFSDWLSRAARD